MNTEKFNLFIVDEDPQLLKGLRRYLVNKFGSRMAISTFISGASALEKVDYNTKIVVLKYSVNDGGNDVLRSIKKINPDTAVIMLSSHEEIGMAIESFRDGATDFVIQGKNAWNRIAGDVYRIMDIPVRVLVKHFGVTKYVAAFILSFIAMGIVVFVTLNIIR